MLWNATQGATFTWDASGTSPATPTDGAGNWSTANANWSDGTADYVWTNGNSAIFGAGGAGASVTVGVGTMVGNIQFNTNYNINGNALILSNSTITVAGSANFATNACVLGGTGFTKEGSGTLVLNPLSSNTNSGETIINNGIVSVGGNDSRIYINGNLTVNSGGTFRYSSGGSAGNAIVASTATILLNGGKISANVSGKYLFFSKLILANGGSAVMDPSAAGNCYFNPTNIDARNGNIFVNMYRATTNFVFKSTADGVIITNRPNSSASDGYVVNINAGTLIFDKTAQSANRLLNNATLTLGGGLLIFSNSASGVSPTTENPGTGGTLLLPGASSVLSTNVGAGGGSITFGTITRRTGGTLDFYKLSVGASSIANASVNGIVGGWATWNKSDWLAGTTLAPYAAYQADLNPALWGSVSNVTLNASPSASLNDVTINSLRITNTSTVTVNSAKTLTLSSGGLLVTGSGAATITGDNLKGGAAGGDIIVVQNSSADLTIGSDLTDNSGTSLTKSGPGKLILTGTDNLTGTNYLNGGTVEIGSLAKLASGPLVMNAGALRYTGSSATETRSVTLNGLGATFDVTAGTTLTLSSPIKGSGAAIGDLSGLTKIGAGTIVLTASNYFNGPTVVSNGVLTVNGTNAYDLSTWDAGKVTVYATLSGAGTVAGPVTVKNGGTISPGNSLGILTLGTNLVLESGSTNLFEVTNNASGDALVVNGNLTIQTNSILSINVLGSALQPTTNTLITYAGTKTGSFSPTVRVVGGTLNCSVSIDETTPGQIKLVASPNVAITGQPADVIANTNDLVSFTVVATGSAPISYQWYYYGSSTNNTPTPITDATNATYQINSVTGTDSGFYAVTVSNANNSVSSRIASLLVGNIAPTISGPFNSTVIAGNNITFGTTVIIANPQPSFRWQTNGVDVGGVTGNSLTLSSVPYALDGTTVSVIASNVTAVVTNTATLTVIVTPVITPQPIAITTNAGSTVVLTSGATGVPNPALQWYKNNVALTGQTNGNLTLVNVQGSDIANYKLVATNQAGTATSTTVKLTVTSTTLSVTALAPANLATGICYDTPLYITFNNPVTIINSGKIRIYNSTNITTPVDTLDMGSNTVVVSTLNSGQGIFLTNNIQPHSQFPGDSTAFNYFPVIVSNNVASIYPHSGVLTSNQTYYVTLDTGVVGEPGGSYFVGISNTNTWRFSTKPTGPANPTNLVVAADGTGDFTTVQGAVDSIPTGGYPHSLINVRNGNYVEIVNISGKTNITLRGQSRIATVIGYGNNNNLNGTTASRMAVKINANDIAFENLTVTNRTPQGGQQAEAIMINTGAARFILNNADVVSLQDTILANVNSSQGYFYNSTIRGNFDYIWGGGNLFFTNCLIYTVTNIYVTNNYNLTAARTDFSGTSNSVTHWLNPSGSYTANGFSFVNCRLQADPGVNTVTLAGANGLPNGLDAFIGCLIDTNHYVTPSPAILSTYVLWENTCSNIDGSAPVSMGLTTLPGGDPRLLAAQSATNWLYGWTPSLAPNILTNPANQTVTTGSSATFNVTATGIPDPTYQWQHAGTNLPGATSAILNIPAATSNDAGAYAVIVTTSAGSVTSTTATLTVNPPANTPPVFTAPITGTNFTINVGVNLSVACTATDSDSPSQTLTYSLLSGPSGSAVNSGTGTFTWRPTVPQSNSLNSVQVVVTDNGTPNLSATNNFTVTVTALTAPVTSSPAYSGGQFSVNFTGQIGPDYALQGTTNLAGGTWTTIVSTNSPASMPVILTDPNAGSQPMQFYRIVTGPPLP